MPDKFGHVVLLPIDSKMITASRVRECPVHLEAVVETVRGIADKEHKLRGRLVCIETRIQRAHVEDAIRMEGEVDRIDPDKWRCLIMSFQKFCGLGQQLHESALATIPEALYQSPDVDRARHAM